MVILLDTRENVNDHITKYFDSCGIVYENRLMKTGDYSFRINACPELGFPIDTYFTDELCIERKNSLSEISGNIVEDSGRIFMEFNRFINIPNVYLLIEEDSLDDIFAHKYKSKLNEIAFLRTILTWQKRNGMYVYFIKKANIGRLIFEICKNCLDESILK